MIRPAIAYCDGGVVGPNPSMLGGTWAYCLLDGEGELLREASGIVEPIDLGLPAVSNNITELLAALRALATVPRDWAGILRTDSKVTLHRLTGSLRFQGVPPWLARKALDIRRGRKWTVELVGGHPTRKELAAGFLRKNGLPCSVWNVRCDELCNLKAKELKGILR